MGYSYILGAILLTVYGQLVLKWQLSQAGPLPIGFLNGIVFLLRRFGNLWILSGYAAGVIAALCWMAALTKFDLSYAYPFMSLAFVLVLGLSVVFLREAITIPKTLGMVLIVAGIVIVGLRWE